MNTNRFDTAVLARENRQLRTALEELLNELEQSGQARGHGQHPGEGPDCECVREAMPDPPGHGDRADEGIKPPWERAGYESKEAWLDDRGE